MNRLGLFTGSGLLGALLTPLVVVVAAFATGGDIFSAGALNAQRGLEPIGGAWSHAELACADCHTAPWSSEHMGDRCVACHTDIAGQLGDPASMHASFGAAVDACRTCHPEHLGDDSNLTLYAPDLYPHAEFGFYLLSHLRMPDGRAFACRDCHVDESLPFAPETCRTCHLELDAARMETHQLDFGFDCLACHDGIDSYGAEFDHAVVAFPLEGKHLEISCSSCHAGAMSLIDLRATPAACSACHGGEDPHLGSLGTDCGECHTPAGWTVARIDHNLTAFPLVGRHVEVACETCHIGGQLAGTATACAGCHAADDPHAGKFGSDCAACHTAEDWSIIIDANFDHRMTGFPLTGAHAKLAACSDCHRGGQFAGTPSTCAACHKADDAHNGTFGDNCAGCHTTNGWKPASFDHSLSGFALTGGHSGVACEGCHAGGKYRGTSRACVACHASDDAHQGAFGTDCAGCHNPSSWRSVAFDHNRTSFALNGSHASAACTQCHVNGRFQGTPVDCVACHAAEDVHRRSNGTSCGSCHDTSSWRNAVIDHSRTAFPLTGRHLGVTCALCHVNGVYRGTPTNCVACHASADKHNGQFGTNCASCHTTSGWAGASFNHGTTAFPLTGRHTGAACAQCHANGVYQGTPTTCYACHASADKHNGQFGTNCASCHTTSGWAGASFNHGTTAFPLTGAHTGLACSQCHGNGVYQGTPKDCAGCHSAPSSHPGFYGSDCTRCHSTGSWAVRYSGGHTFPMDHKGAGSQCTTCHTGSFGSYTCYNCHSQAETVKKHDEKGITDLSDCAACHPNGKNP